MVVDDEEDVVFLVKKILTEREHQVEAATSGQEALDIVTDFRPDLILLDVMMPEMDGWEVSKKLKENEETRDITIAMLTVRSEDEDKVTSFDEGLADWHISKPFTKDSLLKTVEWLLSNPLKREE